MGRQFKSKWLKMVTRMYWIFAYMAFIMVSNARNLLRERGFRLPVTGALGPLPTVGPIAQIGEREFFMWHRLTGIKEAEIFCEEAGGTLAAYLNNHEFHTIFLRKGHFFRKGGVLWIGAIYDINEEYGNRWTWPNFVTIKDIKTSKPTDQDELCGVMDAQLNNGTYEPFIRGHSCDEWSKHWCFMYETEYIWDHLGPLHHFNNILDLSCRGFFCNSYCYCYLYIYI